ncbi:universal stress protein [Streptomyces sp900116325]|uniref:universal stress protein n=1 Tax=Streptomyces sp. 900116325 TaxID=3154295 RepID=UPI0033A0FBE5
MPGNEGDFVCDGTGDVSFRRIVVAYDDSPAARRALHRAITLACGAEAELIVVAVEARLPHYAATVGEVECELAAEERACRRWLAAARALADDSGLTVTEEVRAGPVAREVARAATAFRADLIVVGRRPRRLPLTGRTVRRLAPLCTLPTAGRAVTPPFGRTRASRCC